MTAAVANAARPPVNRQLLVFGGVFALVVAVLGLGYYFFLRQDYVVLAEGLRPADAAVVVAELDKRKADYRLENGGATILVPRDRADATRLEISGSEAAARGQIGFELFNKSDMGLTNFAQKINYQRALQGELVRTILQMDGVESARVHLGLPERALFRGDRTQPSAAVTLALRPGLVPDPARVAGIQRLVAAAVPDLPEGRVVVLDAQGRVISATAPAPGPDNAALDERQAIQAYYSARARAALEARLPGQKFALRALLLPIGPGGDPAATAPADWAPQGEGRGRNFRLRVLVISPVALGTEEQAVAREAIANAVAFDPVRGDDLAFETGPVEPVAAVQAASPSAAPAAAPAPVPAPSVAAADIGSYGWPLIAGGVLAVLALGTLLLRRSGARSLRAGEHDAFAAKLQRQLNLVEETPGAAR
jgi:flagellar M-ring protein FliF